MLKYIKLVVILLSLSGLVQAQISGGGFGGGSGGGSASSLANPVQTGLTSEYRFMASETGSQATDYKGSNPCVFGPTTQAPTRTAYGLHFAQASTQYCDTGILMTNAQTLVWYGWFDLRNSTAKIMTPVGSSLATAEFYYNTSDQGIFNYNSGVFGVRGTVGIQPVQDNAAPGYGVFVWVRTAPNDLIYFNGKLIATTGTTLASSTGNLWIGASGSVAPCASAVCALEGDMLWVDVYSDAKTANDVAQLTGFLNTQVLAKGYTPQIQLPTTTGVMTCTGDSITWGFTTSPNTTWCNVTNLIGTVTPLTVTNQGITGQTMNQIYTRRERVCAVSARSAVQNNMSIFAGTNDISGQSGSSTIVATTSGYMSAMTRYAKDCGYKVFLGTMLSRGTPDDAHRNEYNNIIRAQWRAWGADGLIDFASDPNIGKNGASANTTYFSDGIHPTNLVQNGVMPQYARAVLNYYYGSTAASPSIQTGTTYAMTPSDRFLRWTPSGTATGTLPECLGLTGSTFVIENASASNAITMSGLGPETINGSAAISSTISASYTVMLIDAPNGGCFWQRN